MGNIHIQQIFYDEETRSTLDPGYVPLDNRSNARPDWREYWPMRNFLVGRTLAPDDYYGFFSPRFKEKTNLDAEQVHRFIEHYGNNADVVMFSPYFDMSVLFTSVFEQGERYHPGLLQATRDFLHRIGLDIRIDSLVTDSRNTVFCNYFVAKPRFWARWLEMSEGLFRIAEDGSDGGELRKQLLAKSGYDHNVEMKVFVLERLATLILSTSREFSAKAHTPLSFIFQEVVTGDCIMEIVCADALKMAWADLGHDAYRDAYYQLLGAIQNKMRAATATPHDNVSFGVRL